VALRPLSESLAFREDPAASQSSQGGTTDKNRKLTASACPSSCMSFVDLLSSPAADLHQDVLAWLTLDLSYGSVAQVVSWLSVFFRRGMTGDTILRGRFTLKY